VTRTPTAQRPLGAASSPSAGPSHPAPMAAAQPSPDAAISVGTSLPVTATAYNRVVFWLQMAGTGDRWYTAPSGPTADRRTPA
jgi:Protein of unknown function (DUF1116)